MQPRRHMDTKARSEARVMKAERARVCCLESSSLPPCLRPPMPACLHRPHAFTLTEILVVLGVIVLMLAMAIPAFNFIAGGRSVEGATNQISAFLARARADAVGLQEVRGVMFYLDPATDRPTLAQVKLAGDN